MSSCQSNCFDIISCMRFGCFDTPQELSKKYGFVCHEFNDGAVARTASDGIEICGERFIGQFVYGQDNSFHYCMLYPITGIADDWQSERKVLTEFHICDKIVSSIGKRIGQFKIDIIKQGFRDASSMAERYFLLVKEHPFFTEIYELLENSSMTNEEIANFVLHLEDAISKYKETF